MFVPLFPFPVPIPLIGEQLLPPNRPALPRHGLTAESVILSSPGEKKDRFTHLSQSGKSVWVGGRNPIEGVRLAAGGAGAKSETLFARSPSGDSKGRSPWRAFGDFPRDGKVTRVPSMALPCSRGAPAGGCRGCQPRINSRGRRGGAPSDGGQKPSLTTCFGECRGGHCPLASSSRRRAERKKGSAERA